MITSPFGFSPGFFQDVVLEKWGSLPKIESEIIVDFTITHYSAICNFGKSEREGDYQLKYFYKDFTGNIQNM